MKQQVPWMTNPLLLSWENCKISAHKEAHYHCYTWWENAGMCTQFWICLTIEDQHRTSYTKSTLVTLVTPIFDQPANEATALSVLGRTILVEIVVVDDSSSDDTWMKLQALQRKDARIVALRRNRSPKEHAHAATLGSGIHQLGVFSIPMTSGNGSFNDHWKNDPDVFFNANLMESYIPMEPNFDKSSWVHFSWHLHRLVQHQDLFGEKRNSLKWEGGTNLHVWQDVELHLRRKVSFARQKRHASCLNQQSEQFNKVVIQSWKTWSRWRVARYVMHEGKREVKMLKTNALGNLLIKYSTVPSNQTVTLASEMHLRSTWGSWAFRAKFLFASFRFGLNKIPWIGQSQFDSTMTKMSKHTTIVIPTFNGSAGWIDPCPFQHRVRRQDILIIDRIRWHFEHRWEIPAWPFMKLTVSLTEK